MKIKSLFMLGTALLILASACTKETSVSNLTISEDEVLFLKTTESFSEEVNTVTLGAGMDMGLKGWPYRMPLSFLGKNFPGCAEVTIDREAFPKVITIDYGDECLTPRGYLKTGTITISLSDTLTNEGAVYSLVFENVSFGNRTIDRTATVTNEGLNDNGNWVLSIISETTVNYGDTLTVSRSFTEYQEWISGFGTKGIEDDQFYKTGGGTITVNDDLVFERNITTALFIDRTCRYILSGIVEITRDGESLTIDFGDGECDNIAVVTKDGVSEEIELNNGRFKNASRFNNRDMHRKHGWW